MIVRCFDPGATVGYAMLSTVDYEPVVYRGMNLSPEAALDFSGSTGFDVVLIERMTPRQIVGKDMLAGAELFGALAQSALCLGPVVYGIPRPAVCATLTGSARATKAQVKAAVLAITGDKPKKGEDSRFWRGDSAKTVVKHAWDALALGLAWFQMTEAEREKYRFTF